MKRLLLLLVLLTGLAMTALWGLGALSRSMMFPGSGVRFPSSDRLAPLGVRLLPTPTADGLALVTAFAPPRTGEAPCLLYFHGNAESAAQNLDLAALNASLGWGVALAEYRGYGGMPGSPSEQGLYLDAEGALAALAREGLPSSRLVLVGRSLGTGVAVELAQRGHGCALVLISPYTSMVDLGRSIAGPLAALAVADRFDNASKAASVRLPALVIHGTRDEVVPFAMGEQVARLLPHARLLPIEDVGHNDLPDAARLLAAEIPRLLQRAP